MPHRFPLILTFAAGAAATGTPALGWSTDPWVDHVVSDAIGTQTQIHAAPDGAGGAFVAWEDRRVSASNPRIYVQHIGADGSMLWTVDGVPAGSMGEDQFAPAIASDGAGGAIVVWGDLRGSAGAICGQRIDPNGIVLWAPEGHVICDETRAQEHPRILPDGQGGAFLVWHDGRVFNQEDIYGQRIDPDGAPLWHPDGIPIHAGPGAERSVEIVPDGAGGFVAIATDLSADVIHAARFAADASIVFAPRVISTGPQNFPEIHAAPDGTGGAIVIWRSTGNDLWGQRVDGNGDVHWNGGSDHAICTVVSAKPHSRIAADGAGGAYVTFTDWRSGTGVAYVQHLDAAGTRLWGDSALLVDDAGSSTPNPVVSAAEDGSAIVWWKAHEAADWEIQAQKYLPDGAPQWAADGIDVSIHQFYDAENFHIVPTGDTGSIAVFERDGGATGIDVIAKRLNDDGSLGELLAAGETPAVPDDAMHAFPNPFRSGVRVALEAGFDGSAVEIVDASGRRVRAFADVLGRSLEWNGLDGSGQPVSPGVYFLHAKGAVTRLVRME